MELPPPNGFFAGPYPEICTVEQVGDVKCTLPVDIEMPASGIQTLSLDIAFGYSYPDVTRWGSLTLVTSD